MSHGDQHRHRCATAITGLTAAGLWSRACKVPINSGLGHESGKRDVVNGGWTFNEDYCIGLFYRI